MKASELIAELEMSIVDLGNVDVWGADDCHIYPFSSCHPDTIDGKLIILLEP